MIATLICRLLPRLRRDPRPVLPRGLLYPEELPEPSHRRAHGPRPPRLST